MPMFTSQHDCSARYAIFGPTPGKSSNSASWLGTSPLCRSSSKRDVWRRYLTLVFANPTNFIACLIVSSVAATNDVGLSPPLKAAFRLSTAELVISSRVCDDKISATSVRYLLIAGVGPRVPIAWQPIVSTGA
ncbi:hypothetical protein AYI69_g1041 [Smittium culicis]|uniref:Uncharacterized protein n=1 Tax=Smittium culicis TaxID=133412 RepID=A0A1R1YRC7_9FUNG|nr:hypothetical protein AYI69_g1041 [Smittium culicis]